MTKLLKRLLLSAAISACASVYAADVPADSPVAPEHRRPAEQTFLTFPEWFLVHSPAEYAAFVRDNPPSGFPFIGHIRHLWSSYAAVTREQWRRDLPLNAGYHVMILVIATSTTVEYALRSLYENTLGRVSWFLAGGLTEEDRFAARVAQDYVDFIRDQPWYLFDFHGRLGELWKEVPATGPFMVRKWERRYALTTEYLVKGAYAWLIGLATRSAYTPPMMTTRVVLDRAPKGRVSVPVQVVSRLPDGRVVADLPRYYRFRVAATELAAQGVRITDVAGNTGDILVSAVTADENAHLLVAGRTLFRQPILTRPGFSRHALMVPVRGLSLFLAGASATGVEIEHVHDY